MAPGSDGHGRVPELSGPIPSLGGLLGRRYAAGISGNPAQILLLSQALKRERDAGLRRGIERALRLLEAELAAPKDAVSPLNESPAAEWPEPLGSPPAPTTPPPAPPAPPRDPGGWISRPGVCRAA